MLASITNKIALFNNFLYIFDVKSAKLIFVYIAKK